MKKIAFAALAVLSIALGGVNIIAPSWAAPTTTAPAGGSDGSAAN
jgi:hypothetical protein